MNALAAEIEFAGLGTPRLLACPREAVEAVADAPIRPRGARLLWAGAHARQLAFVEATGDL